MKLKTNAREVISKIPFPLIIIYRWKNWTKTISFDPSGDRGNTTVKSLQKRLHLLPNHINTQVTYTGKKLNTCFNIKDRTTFQHQHDIVYHGKCSEVDCIGNYIGEASRRVSERIVDHNGRDRKLRSFSHYRRQS